MSQSLEQIKNILRSQISTVVFLKNDGERRSMKCTLNMDHVPPSQWPKGKLTEQVSTDQVRVYDVDAKGWRSFNFKNFISIEFHAANGDPLGFSISEN